MPSATWQWRRLGLPLRTAGVADHADLAITLEIGGLHLGKILDPLLTQLFFELLARDVLTPQVAVLERAARDQREPRGAGEAPHRREVKGQQVQQPVPDDDGADQD